MRFITDTYKPFEFYVDSTGILISEGHESSIVEIDGILYCLPFTQAHHRDPVKYNLVKYGEPIQICFATDTKSPKITIHQFYEV